MPFRRYAWLVLLWNLAVVLWGAYVRATGSGAGCGAHWPLCNGVVLPRAPELKTVIEFTHRTTSGVALLLVVGLVWWAMRAFPRGHRVRRGAALSGVLIVTEALLGAGLVLFELVAHNESLARAFAMVAHLANTFLLLAVLALTAWWAGDDRPAVGRAGGGLVSTAPLLLGLLGLLAVGMTGAIAALGDTLFPATSFAEGLRQDFSPTAHFLLRLRILHPLAAAGTGVYLIIAAVTTALRLRAPAVGRLAAAVVCLVFLQLAAGMINLILLAPVWLQLVHLLLADLLWIGLVLLASAALDARRHSVGAADDRATPVPSPLLDPGGTRAAT
ncbi:MAG: COX15/CtaA family protein [Gemmatimonadota bacterium]